MTIESEREGVDEDLLRAEQIPIHSDRESVLLTDEEIYKNYNATEEKETHIQLRRDIMTNLYDKNRTFL